VAITNKIPRNPTYTCDLGMGISKLSEIIGYFLFKGDVRGTTTYSHNYKSFQDIRASLV
jgi:hypothetical protein